MAQRWPWTESEVRATDYSRQNRDYSNKDALEGFSMTTDDGEKAFGWIHNRSYYWYNLVDENDGLAEMINGTGPWSDTVLVQPMDDDKDTTFRPVQLNKDYIVIRNMKRMKKYVIQYFDPLTNKELTNKVIRSSMGGKIKIAPPVIVEEHQDISYKLQRRKKTRHKDKRMTARGSI